MISLKTNKILIVFIGIFLVLIVGCSTGVKSDEIKNEGNKIVVEKQVGEAGQYENCNEIKDTKEVQKVKDILDNISWENAKVSMGHPPNYRFYFENTNGKLKASEVIYALWISPNKDKVELVIDSKGKYIQLNKEKSAELFEIIIGKKLNDI